MSVWAVANQKGGVGKTTTVVSLGGALARRGERVLLVDLDPHGSMTAYFGLDPETIDDSVFRLFATDEASLRVPLAALIHRTRTPGVCLLPASEALATLDRRLAGKEGMGFALARGLRPAEARFERILIDCPPVFGVLMLNALAACERVIAPVQTEFLALKGLERMRHTLALVQRARTTDLDYLIVPTLFDRRTRASHQAMTTLRERHAEHLWDGVIPVDTRFRDASRAGVPLTCCSPRARGSLAYEALLDYLIGEAIQGVRSLEKPALQAHRGGITLSKGSDSLNLGLAVA